ncbi:MAG: sulfurtransferase TusA family protein [Oceanospirillaceae bacterium]|nr:sulfurtransferase TusA family protein [Oceanospirillaceae bacterium]
MTQIQYDQYLDVKEFQCPMPLLKTKQALRYLNEGAVLKVATTDAGSVRDFSVFIEHSKHQMLDMHEADETYYFYIKKY